MFRHFPSFSIMFHHFPSFSMIFHHVPSFSIMSMIFRHAPSFSIIVRHVPSCSSIFRHFPPFPHEKLWDFMVPSPGGVLARQVGATATSPRASTRACAAATAVPGGRGCATFVEGFAWIHNDYPHADIEPYH
jgi:hypothetical protein